MAGWCGVVVKLCLLVRREAGVCIGGVMWKRRLGGGEFVVGWEGIKELVMDWWGYG